MKRFVVLVTVALLLGSILPVAVITDVGVVRAESAELPVIDYIIHSQIRINNESDLANMALGEGWPGDGSPTNPYVISGYNITGAGGGIFIGNTSSHVVISGCYIHNTTFISDPYFRGSGVEAYNASNIHVESNIIVSAYECIGLIGSPYCEIYNNTIQSSDTYAVMMRGGSDDGLIYFNAMSGNQYGGISLRYSNNTDIFNNNITDGRYGIVSSYSYAADMENNTIASCSIYGIFSVGGIQTLIGNLVIKNISVNLCSSGIYLDSTPNSTIEHCSVSNFTSTGITVYAYSNHTNIINSQVGYSYYLSDRPEGIRIDRTSDVSIRDSRVGHMAASKGTDGRVWGIYLTYARFINISSDGIGYLTSASGDDGVSGSDGGTGSDGGDGSDVYGIYGDGSTISIENCQIGEISGGNGGVGGNGGDADAAVPGGNGGDGGNGGNGGDAYGIMIQAGDSRITGNEIFNISGGNGGVGGRGGAGSDGDGINIPDGSGGNGGNGGVGGDSFGIRHEGSGSSVEDNTVCGMTSGDGGNGGSGGDSGYLSANGIGGNGGNGGDSGILGSSGLFIYQSVLSNISYNEIWGIAPGIAGFGGPGGMGSAGSAYDGLPGLPGTEVTTKGMNIQSSNDTFTGNYVHDMPGVCVYVEYSDNQIYYNNFVNVSDAWDSGSNAWDSGYPCGGNYWDVLYTGNDLYSGPDQNVAGSDGIGDAYHNISGGSSADRYPLMTPWGYGMVISTEPTYSESPVNENVVVLFNRSMDTSTTPQLGQTSGDRVGYTFLGWSGTNMPNDTATWSHTDWSLDDVVGLRVYGFSDTEGNPGMPYCWNFHTLDPDAPTVVYTEPAAGERNVNTWTNVVVVFDDDMNTSIVPSISDDHGTNYVFQGWSGTNMPNDTATWSHDYWPDSADITIDIGGAEDTSGNLMAAYNWTFTTVDLTAPYVLFSEPADGDTGVNMSMNVTVIFSESLNTSYNGGAPTLDVISGNDTGGWFFLGWSSTNMENDTATWSHNPWNDEDTMQLRVYDYQDLVGHDGTVYSWSFVTEDITGPSVSSSTPADGATDVSENTDVKVIFSESMDTSIIPVLAQTSGDPVNYTFAGWSGTNMENDTATWSHENWSTTNTGREICLILSEYADLSGNYGDNYTWNFTVVDKEAPAVLSTEPADGDVWVPLDRVFTVVFSESMSYARVYGEVGVTYTFLGWSTTYVHNDTGMWSHTNWSEDTDLTLTVDDYQDLAGNYGTTYSFQIHTDDITAPTVTTWTRPYENQTGVAYDLNVSVVFSESMDTSVIPTLVQTGGDTVNYTFLGWSATNAPNDTALWSHENWTDSDTVALEVSGYHDRRGNIGDTYDWIFHIEDRTPPYAVWTSPYDGEVNVSVDVGQIVVRASEPLDHSFTPEIYYASVDGDTPDILFSHWINETTAVFNMSGNFSESDHIRLRTGGGFLDIAGNPMPSHYWWFYTYDPVAPGVYDVLPAAGDTVEKNETIYITFTERLNESFIPVIYQASDDPGGWGFLGWDYLTVNISGEWKEVSRGRWMHNNWTTERVNLTVSGYRDMVGNWGSTYSWYYNVSIYDVHAQIRIDSDAEMSAMAASEGWAGDGSPLNPYRIEGYSINGDDGRGGYCIYIGNTSYYFVITGNSLNYAWGDTPVEPYYPKASVVLYNLQNGVVEQNRMNVQSDFGVYLDEVGDVSIIGNYIHDYWWKGISVNNSAVYIQNNTLAGSGDGIYLLNSWYSELDGNSLSGDGGNGMTLENSSYVGLVSNSINYYDYGVTFDSGDGQTTNITMLNNSMLECGLMIWGWQYEHWTSHMVNNNTVNNRPLIFLNGVDDYIIPAEMQAGQIFVVDSYNITIYGQFIVRGSVGIYSAVSSLVSITNSTFAYNGYGIYLIATVDAFVTHNNFVGNDLQAWDDGDPGDNTWNSVYPQGGNHWDDYGGADIYSGPNQDIAGPDGIGDTERSIDGGSSSDMYPLMEPTRLDFYYTPGWHMVAFPWLVNPTPVTDTLSGTSWDRAMVYLNGTWYTYNANRDAKYNLGFPPVDRTMGLWVRFTDFSTISGDSPIHTGNITVYVHKGWNLVEGVMPMQVQELFGDVNYTWVKSANLTNPTIMEDAGPTDTLVAGRAYWVYVTEDWTIHIDTDNFTVMAERGTSPYSVSSGNTQNREIPVPIEIESTGDVNDLNVTLAVALGLIILVIGTILLIYASTKRPT